MTLEELAAALEAVQTELAALRTPPEEPPRARDVRALRDELATLRTELAATEERRAAAVKRAALAPYAAASVDATAFTTLFSAAHTLVVDGDTVQLEDGTPLADAVTAFNTSGHGALLVPPTVDIVTGAAPAASGNATPTEAELMRDFMTHIIAPVS